MPRYRRYTRSHDRIFLTLVTGHRKPWLRPVAAKQMLLDAMRRLKQEHPYRHLAHVVLDDHLHWMLHADGDTTVSSLVARLKQKVNFRRHREGLCWKNLWQPRYYDHIIRNEDDFRRHLDYIHYNPVKHGYVSAPCQYPWSSFHAWHLRGTYTQDWGVTEPERIAGLDLE